MRIGFSKDIHRLVLNRRLVLSGVVVPFWLGEEAHSDGDVIYHAASEAILGALALGDLGKHFPDNDANTENMNSELIVKYVFNLMREKKYHVSNIDVQLSIEKPKIAPYLTQMRQNLSGLLDIPMDRCSIKVGTNEKCDAVGKMEAVEATAVVLLEED